jgi:hypothetical protein
MLAGLLLFYILFFCVCAAETCTRNVHSSNKNVLILVLISDEFGSWFSGSFILTACRCELLEENGLEDS